MNIIKPFTKTIKMNKKYWKYIGVQALGLMLLFEFTEEIHKYGPNENQFYGWAFFSGIALTIIYIGIKKQVKYEFKKEQDAND